MVQIIMNTNKLSKLTEEQVKEQLKVEAKHLFKHHPEEIRECVLNRTEEDRAEYIWLRKEDLKEELERNPMPAYSFIDDNIESDTDYFAEYCNDLEAEDDDKMEEIKNEWPDMEEVESYDYWDESGHHTPFYDEQRELLAKDEIRYGNKILRLEAKIRAEARFNARGRSDESASDTESESETELYVKAITQAAAKAEAELELELKPEPEPKPEPELEYMSDDGEDYSHWDETGHHTLEYDEERKWLMRNG